jgi:hypothetical protein
MTVPKHICIRHDDGLVTIIPDALRVVISPSIYQRSFVQVIRVGNKRRIYHNVEEVISPYKQEQKQ